MGVIAVSAGEWRRRKLYVAPNVRPTPLRLRQMLFNWLGQDLVGWRCLDLFAGSGALGIEALSCGAEYVIFVEKDINSYQQLLANLSLLAVPSTRFQVVHSCAHSYIKKKISTVAIDLFLADPPFHQDIHCQLLSDLSCWLINGSLVYWEAEQYYPWNDSWNILRQARVSKSHAILAQYIIDF